MTKLQQHNYKKSKSKSRKQTGGGHHATSSGTVYTAAHSSSDNSILVGTIIGIIVAGLIAIIVYLLYQSMKANNTTIGVPPAPGTNIPHPATSSNKDNMGDTQSVSVAHPELAGYRVVGPDADNARRLSYWDYLNIKDHERIINPLLPPERSYENTYGIPINVPSRGFSGGFQQVGALYKNEVTDAGKVIGNSPDTVIIPIFGRPIYPGGNKWNYYVTSDKYAMVKMPFMYQGRKSDDQYGVNEIMDGDIINLPEYNGEFVVKIYQYDKPRYIPFIY